MRAVAWLWLVQLACGVAADTAIQAYRETKSTLAVEVAEQGEVYVDGASPTGVACFCNVSTSPGSSFVIVHNNGSVIDHNCSTMLAPPPIGFMPHLLPQLEAGRCAVEFSGLSGNKTSAVFSERDRNGTVLRTVHMSFSAETWDSYLAGPANSHIAYFGYACMSLAVIYQWILNQPPNGSCQWILNQPPKEQPKVAVESDQEKGASKPLLPDRKLSSRKTNAAPLIVASVEQKRWYALVKEIMTALPMVLPFIGPFGQIIGSRLLVGGRIETSMKFLPIHYLILCILASLVMDYLQVGVSASVVSLFGIWLGTKPCGGKKTGVDGCSRVDVFMDYVKSLAPLVALMAIRPRTLMVVQWNYRIYGYHLWETLGIPTYKDETIAAIQLVYSRDLHISEIEVFALIPCIMLSITLSALKSLNAQVRREYTTPKKGARDKLPAHPKKSAIVSLCGSENTFNPATISPSHLVGIILLTLIVPLVAHVWMWLMHDGSLALGAPTQLCILNVVGLTFTFTFTAEEITSGFLVSLHQTAWFQAISWKDKGETIVDPFEACHKLIVQKRRRAEYIVDKVVQISLADKQEDEGSRRGLGGEALPCGYYVRYKKGMPYEHFDSDGNSTGYYIKREGEINPDSFADKFTWPGQNNKESKEAEKWKLWNKDSNGDETLVAEGEDWPTKTATEELANKDSKDCCFRTLPEKPENKTLRMRNPDLPLDFDDHQDVEFWWHLRDMLMIDLMDRRVAMEMLSMLCIMMNFTLSFSSVFMVMRFGRATAVSALAAVVTPPSLLFISSAVDSSKNINQMLQGHALFIRRYVAEHKMENEIKSTRSMSGEQCKGWKAHEGLMLQFAEVIERQPPSETLASFSVTSQLHFVIVSFLGFLSFLNFSFVIRELSRKFLLGYDV